MLKKVLFGMLAFASLFATSCTNELEQIESGNTSSVSFKVMTPAMESRAYSDGKTATVLQYAVYDAEGNILPKLTKTDGSINGSTTVNLQLATGNTYSVIFWAGAEGAPYAVDFENKKMTVDYTTEAKTKSNDENRDAFYKHHTFTVNGAQTETIELKRPFAQLNIGTADFAASKSAGYVPTYSSVKVSHVYTTLNLATGAVSDETTEPVLFKSNVIPTIFDDTENEFVGEDFPVAGYNYLAMNYLLVGADQETIEVEYTYTDGSDAKTRTVGSVPVRRNYRTNIYGNLLTSEVDVKVEIKPGYEDDDYDLYNVVVDGVSYDDFATSVAKAMELNKPVEFIQNVKIDADETITVPAGQTLTLNLNGYTLTGVTDDADKNDDGQLTSQDNEVMFDVRGTMNVNKGFVTIKHTSDNFKWDACTEIFYVAGNGTLNVTNATLINYGGSDMAYCIDMVNADANGNGVTVNVETSTLKSSYIPFRVFNNGKGMNHVTVNNTTLEGTSRAFWVHIYSDKDNGGKGVKDATLDINIYNPTHNNTFIANNPDRIIEYGFSDEINFRADGSLIYKTMPTELIFTGDTKYLTGLSSENTLTLIGEGTLELDNINISTKEGEGAAIKLAEGAEITLIIKNDVTLTGATQGILVPADAKLAVTGTGNLVVEGKAGSGIGGSTAGEITIDGLAHITAKGNGTHAFGIGSNGAEVVIKNSTVDYACGGHIQPLWENDLSNGKSEPEGGAAIGGATILIEGSTITKVDGGSKAAGIGAQYWQSTDITIKNSTIVEANGGNASAGIGGSRYSKENKYNLSIKIENSTITATGGQAGAGIGSGYDTYCNGNAYTATNYIEIDGNSVINATGGKYAAGIGTGYHSAYLSGSIAQGATINAVSGEKFYKDTYTTAQDIGYGVVDPTREFSGANRDVTFTVNGLLIEHPWPSIQIGTQGYGSFEAAAAAAKAGETITLLDNVTLTQALTLPAGVTLNGNGKQIEGTINAGGDLTFEGHTKVTAFSASYYKRTITIGEGACLEVTGSGRATLGYGNTFNVTGGITDAKSADKTNITPSLIIPGGISITGGNDATFNVKNAYVQIGSTTSKDSAADGTFTLNIENSIAEFTNQLTFSEPKNGNTSTFNINVINSVLTTATKLILAAPGSNLVVDNSTVTLATYFRNSGKVELKNGSILTGSTIQFGENGGNDGAITVDASTLNISATATGHAFDGKGTGSITLKNGANASVTYYKAMTISKDETSTFTGTEVQ